MEQKRMRKSDRDSWRKQKRMKQKKREWSRVVGRRAKERVEVWGKSMIKGTA